MTEKELKEWLQDMETLNIQIQAWNKCLNYENSNSELQQKSKKNLLQIGILRKSLQILDLKEKFVIEIHLIYKKTWYNTYNLYEDKWGSREGRSVRTLKRMQSNGLKKMLEFIIKAGLEKYFY